MLDESLIVIQNIRDGAEEYVIEYGGDADTFFQNGLESHLWNTIGQDTGRHSEPGERPLFLEQQEIA